MAAWARGGTEPKTPFECRCVDPFLGVPQPLGTAARAGATDEEMRTAARRANIHADIMALPDGYDTKVGAKVRVAPTDALLERAVGQHHRRQPDASPCQRGSVYREPAAGGTLLCDPVCFFVLREGAPSGRP